MSPHHKSSLLVCCAWAFALLAQSHAETTRFIPVTPDNTRMADGSALPEKIESIGWKWIPDVGNHGVWESLPTKGAIQPTLLVTANRLEAGASYEVFGCFWSDGVNGGTDEKNRHFGPVRFGLSLASLHTFDSVESQSIPNLQWIIRPGNKIGIPYGLETQAWENPPLAEGVQTSIMDDGSRFFRARLGVARATAGGTLPVFFADMPYDFPGVARIGGIWLRTAAADNQPPQAIHPETTLHLAIRAGDPTTIQRELDAGADVNALDEDGLTAIFYACAANDPKLVRQLLDHGANPNLANQSLPPLTAAAMVSSVEIVSILLDAGALVSSTPNKITAKLNRQTDPQFFHPIVAAINSGSLPILKLLLAKAPNIDIQSLVPSIKGHSGNLLPEFPDANEVHPLPFLVAGAVGSGHWELAAFLIDKGCDLSAPRADKIHHYGYMHPYSPLMVWAAAAGEDGLPVIEAMMRRGLSPVIEMKKSPNFHGVKYSDLGDDYSIFPWDALSSATLTGHASLVARFLPEASKISQYDQGRLLSLALFSGNREVIDMIRKQFPNAEIKRWKPEANSRNETEGIDDDSLHLLLPRTKPLPPKASETDSRGNVLAVIASPDASGPGAVLSAKASAMAGWKVVDRDEVQTALEESRIAMPWLDGRHSLSELGDRLAADVLVIASKIQGKTFSLYRFESVEVATGLEIHREHYRDDTFNPDKDMQPFLARTTEALERARKHERRQAVSMISFTARRELPNSYALARMLSASIRHEIDSSPGFISLSRSQASRLVEEQALQGKQSIWGATHLLEGAVSPADDGKIKVALRLETIKATGKEQHDVEIIGSPNDLSKLATAAWNKLLADTGAVDTPPQSNPLQTSKNAQEEANRLLREVEWMLYMRMNVKEITPMIEAAAALGAPEDKVMTLHLECLFLEIKNFNLLADTVNPRPITRITNLGQVIIPLPLSLYYSDRIVNSLPNLNKLLQQTAFYFSHSNNKPASSSEGYGYYKGNEFWYTIQLLSYCRAAVYTETMSEQERSAFQGFGDELDQLTNAYFTKLAASNKATFMRYQMFTLDKHVLARNPELVKGLVRMVISGAPMSSAFSSSNYYDNTLCPQYDVTEWLSPNRILAKTLLEMLPATSSPHQNVLRSQANCLLATPDERPQAFRHVMETRAEELAADRGAKIDEYFLRTLLRNQTLGMFFDGFWTPLLPYHGNMVIPDLVHSPRSSPDFMMRHYTYINLVSHFGAVNTAPWARKNNEYRLYNFKKPLSELADLRIRDKKPETIRNLQEATFMWDITTGEFVQEAFAKNYRQYLKTTEKSGSPSTTATLVADFRTVSGNANGFAFQPMRDSQNPSLLWINFLPFDGAVIPTTIDFHIDKDCERKQPWLVAIDCESQKIQQKLNLATAKGLPDCQICPWWTFRGDDVPMVQSKNYLLTNVSWGDPDKVPKSQVAVRIEKKTGSMLTLPNDMLIARVQESGASTISLDDDFYFISNPNKNDRRIDLALYHLNTNGELHVLTEYGRHPEKTPFDAEDHWPKSIGQNGKKLVVMSSNGYLGEYNPADQSWQVMSADSNQTGNLRNKISATIDYGEVEAIKRIDNHNPNDSWTIDYQSRLPGTIVFLNQTRGKKQIHIDIKIPEDFTNQVKYASVNGSRTQSTPSGMIESKTLSHSEHIKTEPLYLTVVNQTRDDLILALRFDPRYDHHNRLLPFLWKISKNDLLNALDDESSRSSAK